MSRIRDLVDEGVQRLCDWVNDHFSGGHALAVVGDGIASLRPAFPVLPIDRRLGPTVMEMAHRGEDYAANAPAAKAKSGSVHQNECSFWAYCHMNGVPCVWCGGRNKLDNPAESFGPYCPQNTVAGQAWYGCCRAPDPTHVSDSRSSRVLVRPPAGQNWSPGLHLIAFADCCGPGYCYKDISHNPLRGCTNYPGAKNWCYFDVDGQMTDMGYSGDRSYKCTVALYQGPC